MGEQPDTNAAPVQPAAIEPAKPVAAETPAPAGKPTPLDDRSVALNDTIEWEKDGEAQQAPLADLIAARQQLQELGDLEAIKNMAGFMKGEPEAQRKVLKDHLAALEPRPEDAKNEYAEQLEGRIKELEDRLGRTERVADLAERQEDAQYVGTMLKYDEVKKHFPWLAAQPTLATTVLTPQFGRLRQAGQRQGVDLRQRNDLIVKILQTAEHTVQSIATAYGGKLPEPEQLPGDAGPPAPSAAPLNPIAPATPIYPGQVSPHVPTPGNVVGNTAPAVSQPEQSEPITRDGLLAKIRAERARQGT